MTELRDVKPALRMFVDEPEQFKHPGGRPPKGAKAMTRKERNKKATDIKAEQKRRCIAVLDMETDPFNSERRTIVRPFAACLYSDQFETVVIWEQDHDKLVCAVIAAIEALPEPYTIYAHNGGKFDYLFLIHKIRGHVSFKGRGIMSCKIGKHELRDSFHIVPERLANLQKDSFDYCHMEKGQRNHHRSEIIRYMISDCVYLFEIVKAFVAEFGLKLSIGQASLMKQREIYDIKKFTDNWDAYIRQFYFGGRTECLAGIGHFRGDYKLYDVNSMYPDVMARYRHPIGAFHDYTMRHGVPGNDTVFIDLNCDNRGALIARNENNETTARITRGRFMTTIWEYEVACRYNLISNVSINFCVDCSDRTDFSAFVMPQYERRQEIKAQLAEMKLAGADTGQLYVDLKRDDVFRKLLLNSGYGKHAQNPREFKEHYLTDPGELPPDDWFQSVALIRARLTKAKMKEVKSWLELSRYYPELVIYTRPHFEGSLYWIWQKPCPRFSFNNVGLAASITGAARAVLLEALQHASGAIYCDTDSIICTGLAGVRLHKSELGAWDLEDEFSEVVIDGKKLYSVMHKTPKKRSAEDLARGLVPEYTVKSKGTGALTWQQMLAMLEGQHIETVNRAPTLNKYGDQFYIERSIKATGQREI